MVRIWKRSVESCGVNSAHNKQIGPQMESQDAKNWLVSRPWSSAYLVWTWRKLVKHFGLWSAHKKDAFGPLLPTIGIAVHPKLIGVMTLVQETFDLNLKKIGRELRGVGHTQEIYVAVAKWWQMHPWLSYGDTPSRYQVSRIIERLLLDNNVGCGTDIIAYGFSLELRLEEHKYLELVIMLGWFIKDINLGSPLWGKVVHLPILLPECPFTGNIRPFCCGLRALWLLVYFWPNADLNHTECTDFYMYVTGYVRFISATCTVGIR